MTKSETAQLATLEANQKNMNDRLDKMDTKIDQILDKLEASDKRFVTRAELNFLKWTVSIVATAVGLAFLIIDHWKT